MERYWFGDVRGGTCVSCVRKTGGSEVWKGRFRTLRQDGDPDRSPPDWTIAADAGCVTGRDDYLRRLQEFCFAVTHEQLEVFARRADVELVELVRALDTVDQAVNLLSERAQEWGRMKSVPDQGQIPGTGGNRIDLSGGGVPVPLTLLLDEIRTLHATRKKLAQEVSTLAGKVLPNCSALVGGLVAARLLSHAGDLDTLVRMPASTLQVIGAKRALFAHIRTGTPPPRHGILYQYRLIHNAPRVRRGKVARVVACKVCIAIKLDCYLGTTSDDFLRDARARIERAGKGP